MLYADNDVFLDERRHPETFYHDVLGQRLAWVDDFSPVLERHEPVKIVRKVFYKETVR